MLRSFQKLFRSGLISREEGVSLTTYIFPSYQPTPRRNGERDIQKILLLSWCPYRNVFISMPRVEERDERIQMSIAFPYDSIKMYMTFSNHHILFQPPHLLYTHQTTLRTRTIPDPSFLQTTKAQYCIIILGGSPLTLRTIDTIPSTPHLAFRAHGSPRNEAKRSLR